MSSVQYSKDFRKNFTESESQLIADYKQFFKSDFILQVGDPRNSLIRCLKNISNFKKSMKSK